MALGRLEYSVNAKTELYIISVGFVETEQNWRTFLLNLRPVPHSILENFGRVLPEKYVEWNQMPHKISTFLFFFNSFPHSFEPPMLKSSIQGHK